MVDIGRHMIRRHTAFISSALMILGIIGCGVKAPPMPPQTKPLAAVTDLTATIDGDAGAIVLTWTAAEINRGIDGYAVYSSRSDLSQPPCQGCPENYEKVGTLSTSRPAASAQPFQFTYSAASGFRYVIRVRPYSESGALGPASNPVEIAYFK